MPGNRSMLQCTALHITSVREYAYVFTSTFLMGLYKMFDDCLDEEDGFYKYANPI